MASQLSATEYRLVVQHSPVMIWRSGLDANCNWFNETWLSFTGRRMEQEVGEGWAEGVHPDDLSRCVAHYLDSFNQRRAFEMEYRLLRHDGEYRWILDRGVPFTDDAGGFAGFIGSCVDVDERRRADALKEQQSAEELSLARDFERQILAIVSHDIRNPLNTIQLGTHRLAQVGRELPGVGKYLDMVTRSVDRIQHIVGDLLDLSRAREGSGIPVSPRSVDLRVLCRRVIEELEPVAQGRKITFECDVDATGEWDEHRVLQAVSNLASNAVQHGAAASPVHVRVRGDAARVVVEVHNGGTIPADLLPRIFDPFRSGRHGATRGDGLGLGLFITRAIAQAHGGSVEVDSSALGTVFRLLLPRQPPARHPETKLHISSRTTIVQKSLDRP